MPAVDRSRAAVDMPAVDRNRPAADMSAADRSRPAADMPAADRSRPAADMPAVLELLLLRMLYRICLKDQWEIRNRDSRLRAVCRMYHNIVSPEDFLNRNWDILPAAYCCSSGGFHCFSNDYTINLYVSFTHLASIILEHIEKGNSNIFVRIA
jgi:hypothetical protein